ncbi:uncharacterized protein K460DRAFT_363876 [Cucurbitaria berberidis CBS 394.84]|uniref:Uncharacterized protein n=1 Tax=Cucurbitaria berberidis CBS 394.84 TaxID=1168544 RepID=A0A9P4GK95_9PLEO|nr:uncharacterized protein K460DRAFT_363876 [Cucurbitaria berberidis CBS 394.84]KAF1847858.1 hypothetical protein K460DRAFT_363876 [Cucurbitaria berberidis CBS 394.84]
MKRVDRGATNRRKPAPSPNVLPPTFNNQTTLNTDQKTLEQSQSTKEASQHINHQPTSL